MKRLSILILITLLIPVNCSKDRSDADIDNISVELQITRFEDILFSADPSALDEYVAKWKEDYPVFLSDYAYTLQAGDINDPNFPDRLKLFVTNHFVWEIYKRTKDVFPDLDLLRSQLTDAFRHYLFYFPEKEVPKIMTFVSALTQSAITDEKLLAIGLDRYLGRDEEIYRQAGIYNYLVKNMNPDKIVSDCMLFWAETEFPFNDSIDNLISEMIHNGRQAYFAKKMLPSHADTLIWGFTGAELDFCKRDERSMWAYLIEHKELFRSDKFTISQYTDPGPFTKNFGRNSAARAANWLGYRIVESYMKKNPDTTLKQLMEEDDYMRILNLSAYNP